MLKRFFSPLQGIAALFFLAAALAPLRAEADSLLYQFGTNVFSGDPPSSTNTPYLKALFEDVSPGTVRFTLSGLALTNNENVGELFLNLNPAKDPTSLDFTSFSVASGSFDLPTIATGVDFKKADGDGKYDIDLTFKGSDLSTWFGAGDVMVCYISGVPGLTIYDFAYLSTPASTSSAGPYYAAVHILSITNPNGHGDTSGWDAPVGPEFSNIPEPGSASLGLLGIGLWFVVRGSRRRFKLARG